MKSARSARGTARYAAILGAMGAEPRLRIVRLLLAAHPEGLVVNDIQAELGMPGSTLSHHLEKLRIAGLVNVRRERQFLWYTADTEALREVIDFLYQECCSRRSAKNEKGALRWANRTSSES